MCGGAARAGTTLLLTMHAHGEIECLAWHAKHEASPVGV